MEEGEGIGVVTIFAVVEVALASPSPRSLHSQLMLATSLMEPFRVT